MMVVFAFILGLALGSILTGMDAYRRGKAVGFKYGSHEQMIGRLKEVDQLRQMNQKLMDDNAAIVSEFYGTGLEVYRD